MRPHATTQTLVLLCATSAAAALQLPFRMRASIPVMGLFDFIRNPFNDPMVADELDMERKIQSDDMVLIRTETWGKSPAQIISLITPERLQPDKTNMRGDTPLHYAVLQKAPVEVFEAMLAAYPEGAQAKTASGSLPLFYAIFSDSPEEVLEALLMAYPEAAKLALEPTRRGQEMVQCTSPKSPAVQKLLEMWAADPKRMMMEAQQKAKARKA